MWQRQQPLDGSAAGVLGEGIFHLQVAADMHQCASIHYQENNYCLQLVEFFFVADFYEVFIIIIKCFMYVFSRL